MHRVSLAMAHKVCRHCYKTQEPTEDCNGCGEKLFYGLSALDDFCHWFFSPRNKDAVAFAHNAKVKLINSFWCYFIFLNLEKLNLFDFYPERNWTVIQNMICECFRL